MAALLVRNLPFSFIIIMTYLVHVRTVLNLPALSTNPTRTRYVLVVRKSCHYIHWDGFSFSTVCSYWLYRVPKDPLQGHPADVVATQYLFYTTCGMSQDQNSITDHQAFQPNQPNPQIDQRNNMPFPIVKKKRSIDCHGPRSCSRTMVIDSTTHMFDTSIA
jgi:hypothetical protein